MRPLHWAVLAVAIAVGAALAVSLHTDNLLPILLAFAFC